MSNLYFICCPLCSPQSVFLSNRKQKSSENRGVRLTFQSSIHPHEGGGDVGVVKTTRDDQEREESVKNREREKPVSCPESDLLQMNEISFCLSLSDTSCLSVSHVSLSAYYSCVAVSRPS